jgi:molecular chaperone DnaK (HSP70)
MITEEKKLFDGLNEMQSVINRLQRDVIITEMELKVTEDALAKYKGAYTEMRNILNPEQWNKIRKAMKSLGFSYHFTPK